LEERNTYNASTLSPELILTGPKSALVALDYRAFLELERSWEKFLVLKKAPRAMSPWWQDLEVIREKKWSP